MRKLYTCIALLIVAFAQAQNITEKGLLGSWHLAKLDLDGYVLDLENGTVTAHDPANEGSQDMEYAKKMLQTPAIQEAKDSKMIFKPGGVIEMPGGGDETKGTYTFTTVDGKPVLYIMITAGVKTEATFEDGLLKLATGTGRNSLAAMYLKKDE